MMVAVEDTPGNGASGWGGCTAARMRRFGVSKFLHETMALFFVLVQKMVLAFQDRAKFGWKVGTMGVTGCAALSRNDFQIGVNGVALMCIVARSMGR